MRNSRVYKSVFSSHVNDMKDTIRYVCVSVSTLGITAAAIGTKKGGWKDEGGRDICVCVCTIWLRKNTGYRILSGDGDAGWFMGSGIEGDRVVCVTANFPSGPARYHPRDKPRGKLGIRLECWRVHVCACSNARARCILVYVRQFQNRPENDNAILSVKTRNNFTK